MMMAHQNIYCLSSRLLNGKGNKERTVYFDPKTKLFIEKYLEQRYAYRTIKDLPWTHRGRYNACICTGATEKCQTLPRIISLLMLYF